jgi:gas vesicle protein
MKRLLIGLVVGVGALGAGFRYFFDPVNGEQRRRNALHLWQKRNDEVLDAARAASGQVQEAAHQATSAASDATSAIRERVGEATATDDASIGADPKSAPKVAARG